MSCLSTTMQCQSCSWFDQQQGCMVVYHLLSKGVHPSCSMTKNRTVTLTPYTIKFSTAHLGLYTKKAELLNKPWQRACVPKKSLRLSNCSQREDIQFSPFVWLCLSKSFQIELIHIKYWLIGFLKKDKHTLWKCNILSTASLGLILFLPAVGGRRWIRSSSEAMPLSQAIRRIMRWNKPLVSGWNAQSHQYVLLGIKIMLISLPVSSFSVSLTSLITLGLKVVSHFSSILEAISAPNSRRKSWFSCWSHKHINTQNSRRWEYFKQQNNEV